jgi:hypothetical protein
MGGRSASVWTERMERQSIRERARVENASIRLYRVEAARIVKRTRGCIGQSGAGRFLGGPVFTTPSG